jgi:hypothetical protein
MLGVLAGVVVFAVLLGVSEMVPVIADHWPVPRPSLSWPFPRPTDPAPFAAGGSLLAAIVAAWGVIDQSRRARNAAGLASREPLRRRTLLDVLNEFEMLGFLVCTSKGSAAA